MSKTLHLSIDMGNAAFDESETGEVARILRRLATSLENTRHTIDAYDDEKLYDINGNRVGRVTITEEE
jgi:hypothetical protein